MESGKKEFAQYLSPTYYIDSDHPAIIEYAETLIRGKSNAVEKAIALFYGVRDDIYYDPYAVSLTPAHYKASFTLSARRGFCIPKAVLLAAVCRAVGIPARLGFADVKNHLTTEKLRKAMGTDLFVYHGYVEMFLKERWVKATPAFNQSLCEKFQVQPLEFDGWNDSLFHEYDRNGNLHMEYVYDHGHYDDLPLPEIFIAFQKHYPGLIDASYRLPGDFEEEATPL